MASAYSIRPRLDARLSMPLRWSDVPDVDPAAVTIDTVPALLAERGDAAAEIDAAPGVLDSLLALADRDAENGLEDLPWPPHYPRGANEPTRAQPSRRRKTP